MGITTTLAARVFLLAFTMALLAGDAGAGGVPLFDSVQPGWVTTRAAGEADVVRGLVSIPHHPNMLGVRVAHMRDTKEYHFAFFPVTFHAADGTPLAGRMTIRDDGRPRPGVVIVPGMAQTKNLRYIVDVAELFARNGWHVLTFDLRGHGDSGQLSAAMITAGWKETDDVLGAVRYLAARSAATSVAVIGFSLGGRSLVRAMGQDEASSIAAGIAVSAALPAGPPLKPRDPGTPPSPLEKFYMGFLGAPSLYEYWQRAARSYGVDVQTLRENMAADTWLPRVRRPLLLLHALDDFLWLMQVKRGRHDGGIFGLAYRDLVRDHPHVRTLLVDRGNHAGMLYLSDPHWFALSALTYLKHWQARDDSHVSVSVPWLDVFAESTLEGDTATYRLQLRNHRDRPVGPVDVHMQIPAAARLEHCWAGIAGLGRCVSDDNRLQWTLPTLPGGHATTGPLVGVIDVSHMKPGPFETRVWVTTVESLSLEEKHAAAARPLLLHKR